MNNLVQVQCALKRPLKGPDRTYPLGKHREYACVYDWKIDRVEVITSVQRRRRWSAKQKARIIQETYAPGMSVSLLLPH